MSHVFRFLAKRQDANAWEIAGDEAVHLTKVLRLPRKSIVEVCDGAGAWSVGTIVDVTPGGKSVRVETDGNIAIEKTPVWPLWICVGAMKPGSIDDLLPSLVELGADVVAVFQQEGGAKSRLAASAIARWHRIMIGAVKQCKRARLPTMVVYESAAALASAASREMTRVVLDPDAPQTLTRVFSDKEVTAGTVLVVGSEHGFTPSEKASFTEVGFVYARLGGYVLRARTAAVAACSVAEAFRLS